MVLFKHPFHLCWIPAHGRDGRVGRVWEGAKYVPKSEQKRFKSKNVNSISASGASNCKSCWEVTSSSDRGVVVMVMMLPSSAPGKNQSVHQLSPPKHYTRRMQSEIVLLFLLVCFGCRMEPTCEFMKHYALVNICFFLYLSCFRCLKVILLVKYKLCH